VDEHHTGAFQELRLAGERRLTLPVVFDQENRLIRVDAIGAVQAATNGGSIAAEEASIRWMDIRAALRLGAQVAATRVILSWVGSYLPSNQRPP
jgi:hypothetical protein